jgi:hypothetical protein
LTITNASGYKALKNIYKVDATKKIGIIAGIAIVAMNTNATIKLRECLIISIRQENIKRKKEEEIINLY